MYKYEVVIRLYREKDRIEDVRMVVEAGNKKLATIRALTDINKKPEYRSLYKSVEEVRMVK